MSQLMTIMNQKVGQHTIPAVSARELYEVLGLRKKFTDWVMQYTSGDDWVKDKDFKGLPLEVTEYGPAEKDYALSLQMAEHIAMMTRTNKGREVREYFRQARDERDGMRQGARLPTPAEALLAQAQMLVDHERQLTALTEHVASQEERLDAIETAYAPPAGKVWPQDWIVSARKERLDPALWKTFLEHARRLERAEPFTPPGGAFPRWYYTPLTLEKAYSLATRQMLLLHRTHKGA